MGKSTKGQDITGWRAGQRVSRTDSAESGTIMDVDGQIKVKWDNGRTSYYPNHSTEIKVVAKD